ncbi:MAG: type II secretion system F family protein [bacterium]|nr:type II secretion system F family protein [bacterium]
MAQFQYRAADPEGKVVEGTIEAAEISAVVARLQDRGLMPIKIGAAGAAKAASSGPRLSLPTVSFLNRLGTKDLLIVTQELSTLLSAGLPLDRSLATLAELADKPALKAIVNEVLQSVRGGKAFADALAQHAFFPPIFVNMVRAGEAGGFLDAVMGRLNEYFERAQEVRDEARAALAYPIVLTLAMGASMLVLLTYVLPKFTTLFTGMGKTLPLSARVVMAVSEGVRSYWWLGLLVIGLVVAGFRYWVRSPAGSYAWDQTKLRMVVFGTVLRKMEVAKIARTLGTLLKSGVPMIQALGIVKEVAGNQVIARAVADIEVGVREGAGVSEPLGRSGVFPPLAIQMIAVGEETGRLDDMLLKVAEYFDREVRVRVQQFTRLLEPVLILVMGSAVGFVVVSMLSAIFSVNDLPL